MGDWTVILLLFITLGTAVILVAVLRNKQTKAGIKLPGRAELYIDTSQERWEEKPRLDQREGGARPRHNRRASQPIRPNFYLEMKLRNRANWIYPLDGKLQVYIGRRNDNDIRLNDPTADTRQAVIYWEDDRYKINNLSRRVPTCVNGRSITKQNIGDGNTIQMGRTKFIFRDRSI
jgi:hypothetical protein